VTHISSLNIVRQIFVGLPRFRLPDSSIQIMATLAGVFSGERSICLDSFSLLLLCRTIGPTVIFTVLHHWSQGVKVTPRYTHYRLRRLQAMVQRQSTSHLCCSAFATYIFASDFALLRLLTWWCHGQFAPPSVNGLSSTVSRCIHVECSCLILSVLPHQCYSSEVDSRQNYSRVHTSNLTEFVSTSMWLNIFVPSLDLCHVNDDSNTN